MKKINEAIEILKLLDLPKTQHNNRSALTLLALLNLKQESLWSEAKNPLMGVTPIIDFILEHYNFTYAPNSRETIRRESLHQFVQAGIVLHNPDNPLRPVNSPKSVYQIEDGCLGLLRLYQSSSWDNSLEDYLTFNQSLNSKYKKERNALRIPINISNDKELSLSFGKHNILIKLVIEEFAPIFVPNGVLLYVGDTENKFSYCDFELFKELNIALDSHGKMPDVIIYHPSKNWLILIEVVVSHGPVSSKRHEELKNLFGSSSAGLVFVTAFNSRVEMKKYLSVISWETEVWSADSPSHLIHFNGSRFLGPYS